MVRCDGRLQVRRAAGNPFCELWSCSQCEERGNGMGEIRAADDGCQRNSTWDEVERKRGVK